MTYNAKVMQPLVAGLLVLRFLLLFPGFDCITDWLLVTDPLSVPTFFPLDYVFSMAEMHSNPLLTLTLIGVSEFKHSQLYWILCLIISDKLFLLLLEDRSTKTSVNNYISIISIQYD